LTANIAVNVTSAAVAVSSCDVGGSSRAVACAAAAEPSDHAGTFAAVARLTVCPSCDSRYLQPLRCEAQEDGTVQVELRCPDCMTVLQAAFSAEEMADLDRSQAACRDEIVAAYERSVSENMEALAAVLGPALALDLVGADDFAPPARGRAGRGPG
jgi:hypothetical protein